MRRGTKEKAPSPHTLYKDLDQKYPSLMLLLITSQVKRPEAVPESETHTGLEFGTGVGSGSRQGGRGEW